jgi:hypothetical protein
MKRKKRQEYKGACWNCVSTSKNYVGLPHRVLSTNSKTGQRTIGTYGFFCDDFCALRYSKDHRFTREERNFCERELIKKYGANLRTHTFKLRPHPHFSLKAFGGKMTIEQYRAEGDIVLLKKAINDSVPKVKKMRTEKIKARHGHNHYHLREIYIRAARLTAIHLESGLPLA